jgi:hypothetical protein
MNKEAFHNKWYYRLIQVVFIGAVATVFIIGLLIYISSMDDYVSHAKIGETLKSDYYLEYKKIPQRLEYFQNPDTWSARYDLGKKLQTENPTLYNKIEGKLLVSQRTNATFIFLGFLLGLYLVAVGLKGLFYYIVFGEKFSFKLK